MEPKSSVKHDAHAGNGHGSGGISKVGSGGMTGLAGFFTGGFLSGGFTAAFLSGGVCTSGKGGWVTAFTAGGTGVATGAASAGAFCCARHFLHIGIMLI